MSFKRRNMAEWLATDFETLTSWLVESYAEIDSLTAKLHAAEEREAILRKAVWVAVIMLYNTHRKDTLTVFSEADMATALKETADLNIKKVEDIYKQALTSSPDGRLAKLEAVAEAATHWASDKPFPRPYETPEDEMDLLRSVEALSNLAGEG